MANAHARTYTVGTRNHFAIKPRAGYKCILRENSWYAFSLCLRFAIHILQNVLLHECCVMSYTARLSEGAVPLFFGLICVYFCWFTNSWYAFSLCLRFAIHILQNVLLHECCVMSSTLRFLCGFACAMCCIFHRSCDSVCLPSISCFGGSFENTMTCHAKYALVTCPWFYGKMVTRSHTSRSMHL